MNYQFFDCNGAVEVLGRSVILNQTSGQGVETYVIRHGGADMILILSPATGGGVLMDADDAAYGGSAHDHIRAAVASGAMEAPKDMPTLIKAQHANAASVTGLGLEDLPQSIIDDLNRVTVVPLDIYFDELADSDVIQSLDFGPMSITHAIRSDGTPIVFMRVTAADTAVIILPSSTS